MRFPDLLATKPGRMAAFFLLYVTEGIPLGFTATAVATQMRRQGIGPAEIGAFVGSLYAPWGLKWAAGPIVDTLTVSRFGRRRFWIILTQLMMIATLLVAMRVDFAHQLKLFTMVIFVHNLFGATQDVAIDALAVNVLPESERGTANGFMFSGAFAGQAIGGSGVLFLTPLMGFQNTFYVVCAWIACVALFVALPLREPPSPPRPSVVGSALGRAGREILEFVRDAGRAFVGTRAALVGVLFAVLPGGAYALGLALQSNLAVELGLNDTQVGALNLWSSIISAVCCVAGGWFSDRFGRRGTLAWTMAATGIPTLALAWSMQQHGWLHPIAPDAPNRPAVPVPLVQMFWASVLVYNVFQGLYYGIRSALFMDVTTRRVAATQFTAYMALMNWAIAYTATWQGWAVEHWGYPLTLTADTVFGLFCLACLPLMKPPAKPASEPGALPAAGAEVPEAISP
jgi:PAT family beta-lactamase induction signal transducer AmpG